MNIKLTLTQALTLTLLNYNPNPIRLTLSSTQHHEASAPVSKNPKPIKVSFNRRTLSQFPPQFPNPSNHLLMRQEPPSQKVITQTGLLRRSHPVSGQETATPVQFVCNQHQLLPIIIIIIIIIIVLTALRLTTPPWVKVGGRVFQPLGEGSEMLLDGVQQGKVSPEPRWRRRPAVNR